MTEEEILKEVIGDDHDDDGLNKDKEEKDLKIVGEVNPFSIQPDLWLCQPWT